MAEYDAGFGRLNGGQGCAAYSNDDGTYAWAESYLLTSLVDMYRGTGNTSYLDTFVAQASLVVGHTDSVRGLQDYRGRPRTGWSATRYSVDGSRASWLVHDAVILEPLLAFAREVSRSASLRGPYGAAADRYVTLGRATLAQYDDLYRESEGEGQYLLEAGFPTVTSHPTEMRPLPLNHDAAAGHAHALLWALTGEGIHRERAAAIGRRLKRHLQTIEGRYVWRYWGLDGQILFDQSWEDISHAALAVRFMVTMRQLDLGFDTSDLERVASTLLAQRASDGFLRMVATEEPDVTSLDAKCGQVWSRRYSDASGLWLDAASPPLYDVIAEYLDTRVTSADGSDPVILAGLAKLVSNYDRRAGGAPLRLRTARPETRASRRSARWDTPVPRNDDAPPITK